MDYWPDDYVEIYRQREREGCNDRALVIRARGMDCRVVFRDGYFLLLVDPSRQHEAVRELDEYDREDHAPPPPLQPLPSTGGGSSGTLAYVSCLLLVAVLAGQHAFSVDWFRAGRLHTGLILDGQWWRVVTALTLHMDIAHLVGNLLVGSVFGFFLGRLLGDGAAWSAILLSGILGNAWSVLLQEPGHSAVGASTAVFGALGILSAYTWRLRSHLAHAWALRLGPLVAGVTLLAWLGTGDEQTDIVAHLTGFLSGCAIGVLLARGGRPTSPGPAWQWCLAGASLLALTGAWCAALMG